jgi:serine protease Do
MQLRRTVTLALVGLTSLAGCRRWRRDFSHDASPPPPLPAAPHAEPAADQPPPAPLDRVTLETGFGPVVERIAGAVVNISTTRTVRPAVPEQVPFFDDPFFRDFFGHGQRLPPEVKERALGSGVIVSADGYVLTNSHVVQGATDIRVSLPDKRELKATVVGQDPQTDLAVLRIPGTGFPVAQIANSSRVRVGDVALAIGDPLGLGQTVTMGIISAKGRGDVGIVDYEDFIQTDAAINPGNSGGALVDLQGRLIGINTAIATSGGGRGNQGIGFSVPSNLAREVMSQIEQRGRVVRGWLGVAVQDVTPSMATGLGLKTPGGALVGDVTADSPAAKAGFERGDVVVDVDGKPVASSRGLRLLIAESSPGTRVRVGLLRNGARRELVVALGEVPTEQQRLATGAPSATGALGIQVAPLMPEMARRLGVPEGTSGALIAGVQPGSRAAEAGLRPGDVIEEIDKARVRSADDVKKALERDAKQTHVVLVWRAGTTHYVALPPEGE